MPRNPRNPDVLTEAEQQVLTHLSYVVQVIPDDVLVDILNVLRTNLTTEPDAAYAEVDDHDMIVEVRPGPTASAGAVVAWRSEVFDGSTLLSFADWQAARMVPDPEPTPYSDWQAEVAVGNTTMGYVDWARNQA